MNDTTNAATAPTGPIDETKAANVPAADGSTTLTSQVFHFKTEKLRNEKGEVIGDGKKHPSVTLALPVPSWNKVATWLTDATKYAKELELLGSTMLDQVYRVARMQINDWRDSNKDGNVTAASLNYEKLDWNAIANMPKGERASVVPAEEDIKAFLASYLAIMPAALNRDKEKIENHVVCFQTTFRKQRSQKEILEAFAGFLEVYISSAGEETLAEHEEVVEYFANRLKKLMETEEKITLDSL